MGQGSRWVTVVYRLKESNNSEQQKETNGSVKMGQGSRWVTVVYRLKESNNSEQQKETNGRVKMGQGSKWAKRQDWPRVKIGQVSR